MDMPHTDELDTQQRKASHPEPHIVDSEFLNQLENECEVLAHYAFSKGLTVPGKLMRLLNSDLSEETDMRAQQITDIYNQLAELVAPAKPQTILLMYEENKEASPFLFLGSVPLIRRMMAVALISLFSLIGLSLSGSINNENMVSSMFDLEGTDLLYVQAMLLASAAIGASFAGLFKANSYVTQGIYDPKHESSYWVRFVVGLISGITLTQLIPINLDSVAQSNDLIADSEANHAAIRITTALLGGFSANLVYNLLDRIVETLKSFITPKKVQNPAVLRQQLENQYRKEKLQFVTQLSQELLLIKQELASDENMCKEKMQDRLTQYLEILVNGEKSSAPKK
ncbi:conserved hypothetical protein [Vibrio nigripulchritudo MADA3029]|uniref:Uncharacterized protein n=1 Tax=Vibrio nigripulchritudo TaxID=28173 RepID=U4K3M9_9VIBR|nr:hypothetical protein [Vibrio nigripulchritudo]KJY80641.1 hypothetical protein TW74_03510 [Vibrio nigripulchritudo]CCN47428.1 conserved hypothetical protein [Vibrio nigripulchritudo MADA3020]CCN56285.1 conserved hypothetical protein [Vibrio nigripulchritudo MADA3021]CCN58633.1 conserved hypothetical protein [Vibrio nigripulchritudo MADA3029]CCN83756.1 conserved hypothetical protein [Vibrio nigripulchritudo BLFn1]